MGTKWVKTKFPGVRYRQHPTRKHGVKFDRYYAIRYQKDGTRKEEGLGWASESWTEEKAALTLAELKQAKTTGKGEASLKERRRIVREEEEQKKIEGLTFAEFFSKTYFPQAQQNKTKGSYIAEKNLFNRWINPAIGNKPLIKISVIDIERIKQNMAKAGRAPRTITYALAVVRQTFNLAKSHDLYTGDNPVSKVKKPTADNKRNRFLTPIETDILFKTLKVRAPQLHDIALLSLDTGMRAGEIFNLTWSNVHLDEGFIMIMDTKAKRNRPAYLTDRTKTMFESLEAGAPSDPVFKNRNGNKVQEVSNTFARIVKDLGFNEGITDNRQKVVFHSLRHTFASRLVQSGTDLYTVEKLMGHSNIAMTERYSHLGNDLKREAVRNMEKTFARQEEKGTGADTAPINLMNNKKG